MEDQPKALAKCVVCGELTQAQQSVYCPSHAAAMREMHKAYSVWSAAYGTVGLEQFLARLLELAETGDRVKELSNFLLKNMDRWAD
jgi:hypothetical protein